MDFWGGVCSKELFFNLIDYSKLIVNNDSYNTMMQLLLLPVFHEKQPDAIAAQAYNDYYEFIEAEASANASLEKIRSGLAPVKDTQIQVQAPLPSNLGDDHYDFNR